MKVTPLTISIIYQGDAVLVVQNCDRHNISRNQNGEVEYVNIIVTSTRRNVDKFIIRVNSTDFQDLQDRVNRSIEVPSDVKFHKTVIEKFVETFKEFIELNPTYKTQQVIFVFYYLH